ncbi:hypothetical protein GGR57DRAFT_497333 [Xylariaceae sp. FL1272]|nr:hypothetical protein GGR57DRAFT_497333 [Xylariaceae sp. FL1272]
MPANNDSDGTYGRKSPYPYGGRAGRAAAFGAAFNVGNNPGRSADPTVLGHPAEPAFAPFPQPPPQLQPQLQPQAQPQPQPQGSFPYNPNIPYLDPSTGGYLLPTNAQLQSFETPAYPGTTPAQQLQSLPPARPRQPHLEDPVLDRLDADIVGVIKRLSIAAPASEGTLRQLHQLYTQLTVDRELRYLQLEDQLQSELQQRQQLQRQQLQHPEQWLQPQQLQLQPARPLLLATASHSSNQQPFQRPPLPRPAPVHNSTLTGLQYYGQPSQHRFQQPAQQQPPAAPAPGAYQNPTTFHPNGCQRIPHPVQYLPTYPSFPSNPNFFPTPHFIAQPDHPGRFPVGQLIQTGQQQPGGPTSASLPTADRNNRTTQQVNQLPPQVLALPAAPKDNKSSQIERIDEDTEDNKDIQSDQGKSKDPAPKKKRVKKTLNAREKRALQACLGGWPTGKATSADDHALSKALPELDSNRTRTEGRTPLPTLLSRKALSEGNTPQPSPRLSPGSATGGVGAQDMPPAATRRSRSSRGVVDLPKEEAREHPNSGIDPSIPALTMPTTTRRQSAAGANPAASSTAQPERKRRASAASPSAGRPRKARRTDDDSPFDDNDDFTFENIDLTNATEVPEEVRAPIIDKRSKLGHFQCAICLDYATDMTTTHCGHLFCSECLHSSLNAENNPRRRCPVCRTVVEDQGRRSKDSKSFFHIELKLSVAAKKDKGKQPATQ